MAREKKKMTKEEQAEELEKLKARKERDAKLGYKYSPCKHCGEAVRWRFSTGVKDTPENTAIYEPKHCGKEECAEKQMNENLQKKEQAKA